MTRGETAVMLNRLKQYVDANYDPFEDEKIKPELRDLNYEFCHFKKTKDRVYKVKWDDGDGTSEGPEGVRDRWFDRNGKLLLKRNDVIRDRFTLPMSPDDFCFPISRNYFYSKIRSDVFDSKEANLKLCPDSYSGFDESGLCTGEGCDGYTFHVQGEQRWTEEFNVPWVKEHCPNLNLPNSLQ